MDAGSKIPEAECGPRQVGNDGDHRNLNKAHAANAVRGRFTGKVRVDDKSWSEKSGGDAGMRGGIHGVWYTICDVGARS